MSAIEQHDEMVRAYHEQQAQLVVRSPGGDIWTGALAARFRENPRRPLDPTLESIAADLHPDDVLIDVGGGAGRFGLPLALRCREVVVVDPSEGMQQQFDSVRAEARIDNARYIRADWLNADGIEGDCALVAHVTYFVPDIQAFVRKLASATRRKVTIVLNSEPPPNTTRDIFALVHGKRQAPVPGHRELLPALWEMGFLPDVRILPVPPGGAGAMFGTRDEAVEWLASSPINLSAPPERLRTVAREHFDELFVERDGGWVRKPSAEARPILITWQTGSA